jgi:hypothetical protein
MTTFLATIAIVATLMAGMAIGVIFSNKPLRGSCGGVQGDCACEEAGTPGACKTGPEGPDTSGYAAPGKLLSL